MIEIDTELVLLRQQLASTERHGRTLTDARLRMFLSNKLRHLEADLSLRNRPSPATRRAEPNDRSRGKNAVDFAG